MSPGVQQEGRRRAIGPAHKGCELRVVRLTVAEEGPPGDRVERIGAINGGNHQGVFIYRGCGGDHVPRCHLVGDCSEEVADYLRPTLNTDAVL